ncbi:hypothetical protein Goari_022297, partial [Gossypium aridum]|nr:hypothetical protein [Gossypium aridum]
LIDLRGDCCIDFIVEDRLAGLSITIGENKAWCFLTVTVVHLSTMQNTLATLSHLLRGVQISNMEEKRYLFRFFHQLDIDKLERFARRKLWDNNLLGKKDKNNLVLGLNLEGIMTQGRVLDDVERDLMEHGSKTPH